MPFLVFDEMNKETVTPKYSTAYGELVTITGLTPAATYFFGLEALDENGARSPASNVSSAIAGRSSIR